jgi:hypothetical protein
MSDYYNKGINQQMMWNNQDNTLLNYYNTIHQSHICNISNLQCVHSHILSHHIIPCAVTDDNSVATTSTKRLAEALPLPLLLLVRSITNQVYIKQLIIN